MLAGRGRGSAETRAKRAMAGRGTAGFSSGAITAITQTGVVTATAGRTWQTFRYAAFSVAGPLSAVGFGRFSVLAGLLLDERPTDLALAGIALARPAIVAVPASAASAETDAEAHSETDAEAQARRR